MVIGTKQALLFLVLSTLGIVGWFTLPRLSSDALGMFLGVLFGMFAGIPTLLLILASQRRRSDFDDEPSGDYDNVPMQLPPDQPTVINHIYNDYRQINVDTAQPAMQRLLSGPMPTVADRRREIELQNER